MNQPSFFRPLLLWIAAMLLIGLLIRCSAQEGTPAFTGSDRDVRSYASQVVPQLMDRYYPLTGSEPVYEVHSWEYDTDSQQYTVDMSAYWNGQSCLLCDDVCRVGIRGNLTIGADGGKYKYEITGLNDCTRQHNLTGLVLGTVLDIAASSGN
jgi:hypothetical protein